MLFHQVSGDDEFVTQFLDTLDKEFHFWMDHRMVDVVMGDLVHRMAVYNVAVDTPRPGK